MVVHLPGAVDAHNAEDHKDHGPRVHQRPHRGLPAAGVHAGVEAESGREAGPGACGGSHSCTVGGADPQAPRPRGGLPARTFLTRHVEEAFGRPVRAGAEQAAGRGRAHAPVEGWLVRLREVQFPVGEGRPGLRLAGPGQSGTRVRGERGTGHCAGLDWGAPSTGAWSLVGGGVWRLVLVLPPPESVSPHLWHDGRRPVFKRSSRWCKNS